jgi:hypothetical protein
MRGGEGGRSARDVEEAVESRIGRLVPEVAFVIVERFFSDRYCENECKWYDVGCEET